MRKIWLVGGGFLLVILFLLLVELQDNDRNIFEDLSSMKQVEQPLLSGRDIRAIMEQMPLPIQAYYKSNRESEPILYSLFVNGDDSVMVQLRWGEENKIINAGQSLEYEEILMEFYKWSELSPSNKKEFKEKGIYWAPYMVYFNYDGIGVGIYSNQSQASVIQFAQLVKEELEGQEWGLLDHSRLVEEPGLVYQYTDVDREVSALRPELPFQVETPIFEKWFIAEHHQVHYIQSPKERVFQGVTLNYEQEHHQLQVSIDLEDPLRTRLQNWSMVKRFSYYGMPMSMYFEPQEAGNKDLRDRMRVVHWRNGNLYYTVQTAKVEEDLETISKQVLEQMGVNRYRSWGLRSLCDHGALAEKFQLSLSYDRIQPYFTDWVFDVAQIGEFKRMDEVIYHLQRGEALELSYADPDVGDGRMIRWTQFQYPQTDDQVGNPLFIDGLKVYKSTSTALDREGHLTTTLNWEQDGGYFSLNGVNEDSLLELLREVKGLISKESE